MKKTMFVLLASASFGTNLAMAQGSNFLLEFNETFFQPDRLFAPFVYEPDGAPDGAVYIDPFGATVSVVIGPEYAFPVAGPTTRFIHTPLLATLQTIDPELRKQPPFGVIFTFETPTPIFGFGLGYNDLNQPQNGSDAPTVGTVELLDERGNRVAKYKLEPTRLFCCTETRVDYSICDDKAGGSGYVKTAIVEFDYQYTPFDPLAPIPTAGDTRFFGLDTIDWSTKQFPECEPKRRQNCDSKHMEDCGSWDEGSLIHLARAARQPRAMDSAPNARGTAMRQAIETAGIRLGYFLSSFMSRRAAFTLMVYPHTLSTELH